MDAPLLFDMNESSGNALKLIDDTIKRYQTYILTLKNQRNNFISISRLPPEVLSHIFMIVRVDAEEPEPTKQLFAWTKLTHVSRYWRNVAIASPNLWAYIDNPILDNSPWLEECLRRSKDANLTIHTAGAPSKNIVTNLELALQHSGRIQDLVIRVSARQWQNVSQILPRSAPRLNLLCLGTFGTINNNRPMFGEILCDAPNLRHLDLTNFVIQWNPSHFQHNLTYLRLSRVNNPTWPQFTDVLKVLPTLQCLILYDALPVWDEGDYVFQISEPIHLSSLQKLTIELVGSQSLDIFLSSFIFPRTTQVKIECFEMHFSSLRDHISKVLSELTPKVRYASQTLSLEPPFSLCLGFRLKLFVDAWTDNQMLLHQKSASHLDLTLCWPEQNGSLEQTESIMNIVFGGFFPLQSISCFWLAELPIKFDSQILATTIGRLPQIHSVIASPNAHGILVNAMQLGLDTQSGRGNPHFPNVISMRLHGKQWVRESYHATTHALSNSMLYDCLSLRLKAGVGLQRIICEDYPKLTEEEAKLFSRVVKEIEWKDNA